jgi:Flp pilus assembly protein TadG
MKKRVSLLRKSPCGQTLAEFAVVATVFFVFVIGIIEMAIVVYQYNTISQAARDAARYAIAHHNGTSANPDDSNYDATIAVATNEATFLNKSDVVVDFPADPGAAVAGQLDARVTITHTYHQYIPGMSPLSLTLTSSSRMLLSQ